MVRKVLNNHDISSQAMIAAMYDLGIIIWLLDIDGWVCNDKESWMKVFLYSLE